MRECEYHMEIWGINDLSPAFVHPDFLLDCLTVGAVTVTAGIIVHFHVAAFSTLTDIVPKAAGFAVQDGMGGFPLDFGLVMPSGRKNLIGKLPYFLDFQVSHVFFLPSGQKD